MRAMRGGTTLAALAMAAGSVLAACGDDGNGDDATGATTEVTAPGPEEEAAEGTTSTAVDGGAESGGLTVDNLADRCEDLAPIVRALRDEEPVEIDGQGVGPVSSNDFEYVSSHCTFAYEGDTFSDKNRVDIYFDSAPDDRTGIQDYFGQAALTEVVEGLGYPASYYLGRGSDANATARALVGTDIVRVISTAPKAMADEPFIQKDPLVAALAAVIAEI